MFDDENKSSNSPNENSDYEKEYDIVTRSWQEYKTKNEKKYLSKSAAAIMLVLCITVSAATGLGGGLLSYHLLSMNQPVKESQTSESFTDTNPKDKAVISTSSNNAGYSLSGIISSTQNSVVAITTETQVMNGFLGQYTSEGAGSGVIISKDGYIVTNNHVINGSSKITVQLKNGNKYDAALVGSDSKTDVAILKINQTGLSSAVIGDSSKLKVGDLAVAVGNPLGVLGGTVTSGIISALDREINLGSETMNLLQTDAAINPGNSGGALVNEKGELIGIVVAKTSGADIEGLGFAIPINDIKPVIDQLMTNGFVKGRITLGITYVEISNEQAAQTYKVNEKGLYVITVKEDSCAFAAGIRPGDLIVSMDGKKIQSTADIKAVITSHEVGDKVSVTIVRQGKRVENTITFTENIPNV